MWDEGERWRQRLRVGIFVLALSALVTAWWQHTNDARSMPAIFSSLDRFLGPTPSRSTAASAPAPPTGPASSVPASVGTTGRGGNAGSRSAATASPSLTGSSAPASVSPPLAIDGAEPVAVRSDRNGSPLQPCEPQDPAVSGSDAGRGAPRGDDPCDTTSRPRAEGQNTRSR